VELISSQIALRVLVSLMEANRLSLTRLAGAVGNMPSAVQRALRILTTDALVMSEGEGRKRVYRLSDQAAVAPALGLAVLAVPKEESLGIIARARPCIEFLALEGDLVRMVYADHGDPIEESRAARAVERICQAYGLRRAYGYHGDIREQLATDASIRDEVGRGTIIHGSMDRTFPDRSLHGQPPGEPLGHPHPDLALPSRRRLEQLRRLYGVQRFALFGSAVRSDFRPDSDVDVLVAFEPDVSERFDRMTAIELEFEAASGRDVDVVAVDRLPRLIRDNISDEVVEL
jgi:uncharacterized protein